MFNFTTPENLIYDSSTNTFIHQDNVFRLKSQYKGKICANCTFPKCKGVIVFNENELKILKLPEHTHLPNEVLKRGVMTELQRFYNDLRDTTGNLPQLVDNFISKFSPLEFTFLPKRKSIIDRARKFQINSYQYTYRIIY